jgi:predicted nucleic acid-binding protein
MIAVDTNLLVRLVTGDDVKQAAAARSLFAAGAALALTVHGIELAETMRLSSRPIGGTIASFDQSFVRRVKRGRNPSFRSAG